MVLISQLSLSSYFSTAENPCRRRFSYTCRLHASRLDKVPVAGDHFERQGFRFEVVDMDGQRIDKVLVVALAPTSLE